MCWLLLKNSKQEAAAISSELQRHVKTLREVVELELGTLCDTLCSLEIFVI